VQPPSTGLPTPHFKQEVVFWQFEHPFIMLTHGWQEDGYGKVDERINVY